MAGDPYIKQSLIVMYPHTHNALTKLVMSMADVAKNTGKKTFFGRDKGQKSYNAFREKLKVTIQCMILDSIIKESTPTEELIKELEMKIKQFQLAYPNWQDAYSFSEWFFESEKDAIAAIESLR
jgi:hypothetical protein